MIYNPADLNQRVTLIFRVVKDDKTYQPTGKRIETWANIKPVKAMERVDDIKGAVIIYKEMYYTVTIRYRKDIDSTTLIQWDNITMQQTIPAIDRDNKKESLELTCKAYADKT